MAEPLRSYEQWANGIRNFNSWLGSSLPGGSDLDFICERKGNFLVVEGKPWKNGVMVPWGQHLLLKALSELEAFTVLLIGEATPALHVMEYDAAEKANYFKGKGVLWGPEYFTAHTVKRLQRRCQRWWDDASRT